MGLIQRAIEREGIPTVGVSIARRFTEEVRPPRSVFVKWPMGHPLGEPGRVETQTAVIGAAFKLLVSATEPGIIVDLPFRWRRYEDLKKEV